MSMAILGPDWGKVDGKQFVMPALALTTSQVRKLKSALRFLIDSHDKHCFACPAMGAHWAALAGMGLATKRRRKV